MSFAQDLRHAARLLRKAPWFTFASALVLALGISTTTAMFSLVDAALIRPLPFPDSGRLVMVWERAPRFPRNRVAPLNFLDWSEQAHVFTAMAATAGAAPGPLLASTGEVPDTVFVQSVTVGFFDVLGVPPIAGRTFVAADAVEGVNAAVVSERLWRTRFGVANGFVGRVITIGSAGTPFTVVGIMRPRTFKSLDAPMCGRCCPSGERRTSGACTICR